MGATIAYAHHERFDGSGYPQGLAGEAIPIEARITAVADVFDALCSPRTYKKPWTIEQAFDYVQDERGRQFDPDCVDAFLATADRSPRSPQYPRRRHANDRLAGQSEPRREP